MKFAHVYYNERRTFKMPDLDKKTPEELIIRGIWGPRLEYNALESTGAGEAQLAHAIRTNPDIKFLFILNLKQMEDFNRFVKENRLKTKVRKLNKHGITNPTHPGSPGNLSIYTIHYGKK